MSEFCRHVTQLVLVLQNTKHTLRNRPGSTCERDHVRSHCSTSELSIQIQLPASSPSSASRSSRCSRLLSRNRYPPCRLKPSPRNERSVLHRYRAPGTSCLLVHLRDTSAATSPTCICRRSLASAGAG